MTKNTCSRCGKLCRYKSDNLPRADGRYICRSCWSNPAAQKYRGHWFVRSLQYDKPSVTPPRRRKPFPGQGELFPGESLDD